MTKVLVVDDDFMVADVHRRLVEREPGFTVVGVAHTAADALRAVTASAPDLVLLDLYLPDRSGLDVLAALRVSGAPCDVVVITAARDLESVRAVMRLGGLHYLIKPFDSDALRAELLRVAQLRRTTASLDAAASMSQTDVDHAFAALRTPTPTLPKGLSAVTLNAVNAALAVGGDHSSVDVALAVGVSRASARRYLEHLVTIGLADLSLRYGATGRPEHRYQSIPPRPRGDASAPR